MRRVFLSTDLVIRNPHGRKLCIVGVVFSVLLAWAPAFRAQAQETPIGGLYCNQSAARTYTGLKGEAQGGWYRHQPEAQRAAEKECLLKLENQANTGAGRMWRCINNCILGTIRSCERKRAFVVGTPTYGLPSCIKDRRAPPSSPGNSRTQFWVDLLRSITTTERVYSCKIDCSAEVTVTDTCGECRYYPRKSSFAFVATEDGVARSEDEMLSRHLEAMGLEGAVTPEDIQLFEELCSSEKAPDVCQEAIELFPPEAEVEAGSRE